MPSPEMTTNRETYITIGTSFLGSISILDTISTSLSFPSSRPIQVFFTSPTISTIVSISKSKGVRSKVKPKTPLKKFLTSKEINEDINLDKEIVITKLDLDNATIDEMRLVSKLLEKKVRQKQLRDESDREFTIIENAKNIITKAIGVDFNSSQ